MPKAMTKSSGDACSERNPASHNPKIPSVVTAEEQRGGEDDVESSSLWRLRIWGGVVADVGLVDRRPCCGERLPRGFRIGCPYDDSDIGRGLGPEAGKRPAGDHRLDAGVGEEIRDQLRLDVVTRVGDGDEARLRRRGHAMVAVSEIRCG